MQEYVATFALRKDDHNNLHILLLKRAADKKTHPNLVTGVGGKVEPGETKVEAAVREFKQEVGVTLDPNNTKYFATIERDGLHDEYGPRLLHYFVTILHTDFPTYCTDGQLTDVLFTQATLDAMKSQFILTVYYLLVDLLKQLQSTDLQKLTIENYTEVDIAKWLSK